MSGSSMLPLSTPASPVAGWDAVPHGYPSLALRQQSSVTWGSIWFYPGCTPTAVVDQNSNLKQKKGASVRRHPFFVNKFQPFGNIFSSRAPCPQWFKSKNSSFLPFSLIPTHPFSKRHRLKTPEQHSHRHQNRRNFRGQTAVA